MTAKHSNNNGLSEFKYLLRDDVRPRRGDDTKLQKIQLTFDCNRDGMADLVVLVATLNQTLVSSLIGVPIHPVN